jgi:hypothetical protein
MTGCVVAGVVRMIEVGMERAGTAERPHGLVCTAYPEL